MPRRFELRRALVHLGALVEPGQKGCPRGGAVADAAPPVAVPTCDRTASLSGGRCAHAWRLSLAAQAEAERERRARIITADGECQASKWLAARLLT